MILEFKLPAYIVAYLKSLYGSDPYNLANQDFRGIKLQIKLWNLIGSAMPQTIIMPRTRVPIRFEIPESDAALMAAAKQLEATDEARREAVFVAEFWTSMVMFVVGQRNLNKKIRTGEAIENFLIEFDIPDQALSTDSARRMFNRFLEERPSLAALSRFEEAS